MYSVKLLKNIESDMNEISDGWIDRLKMEGER